MKEMVIIINQCLDINIEDNGYTVYSTDDLYFELGLFEDAFRKKVAFIENQISENTITKVRSESFFDFFWYWRK